MAKIKVYLAGPIADCSDFEARGWRDHVKRSLCRCCHEWLDPMDRDYRSVAITRHVARDIVEGDLAEIRSADVVLVNALRGASWGTAMEIRAASQCTTHAVAVLVVCDAPNPSPWLVYHADVIVRTLDEAIALIRAQGSRVVDAALPT